MRKEMEQQEMTRITKLRISEIIARIEMYGHGAGYTADEVPKWLWRLAKMIKK